MSYRNSSSLPQRLPLGCALVLLLAAATASAGKIEAPLDVLYSSSNVLIAGKLVRIDPTGHFVFDPREILSGTRAPTDRITVAAGPGVLAKASKGQNYIVGYTIMVRDPHNRKGKIPNPEGPRLLSSPGLEPALFEDSRALRAILGAAHDEAGRESHELLELLLTAVAGDDAQLQNLAAHELVYRPGLAARLDSGDQALLGSVVNDPSAGSSARAALLQAAFHNPDRYGDWWRLAAQKLVTTTPVDGYINQSRGLDSLVMAAFSVLQAGKASLPTDALVRWVGGASPAISERALLMLRRQAPHLERSSIQHALADPALPTQTRMFLKEHLRRLDFMEKKLREGADRKAAKAVN